MLPFDREHDPVLIRESANIKCPSTTCLDSIQEVPTTSLNIASSHQILTQNLRPFTTWPLPPNPLISNFHSPLTQHHSLSLGQTIGNRLALNITYITSDAANIKIACEHSHCSQQLYLADEEASTPVRSA